MQASTVMGSQQLNAVLHAMSEAIVATDAEGRITLVNPAAEKLFDVRAAQVIGQSLRAGALHTALGHWLDRAIDSGRTGPTVFEIEIGPEQFYSVSLAPIPGEAGRTAGWVALLQDVSHLRKMEQWKSEAIQAAAHDLRSPLSVLTGALSVLINSISDPTSEQQECIQMLNAATARMQALVEQLLNLEQIESGREITLSKLTLRRVVEAVVEESKLIARQNGVELALEAAPATAKVLGEEQWLHRATANLVNNAIKYTPKGGRVVVRYREEGTEGIVEVTDTGPGIPPGAQARLFERFYRVRNESSRSVPGAGLGLAIVKSIVERHAGRVWVSSEEGKGSTFAYGVPLLK